MKLYPVTGVLGAEVSGIDLGQTLNTSIVDEIHAALVQHQVLFFANST